VAQADALTSHQPKVRLHLLTRVSRFARRHNLWQPTTRVIAAVSGGSDSVALALVLRDLHQRGELTLAALAHLHHGIRRGAADDDQRFCERLAADLEVPFETTRVDVPSLAECERLSIEVAGRRARQEFFRAVLADHSADCVATAHTADDQAETVLLRLLRGTGLKGLAGIAPVRDRLIRPLLECTRSQLRDELERRQQPWREDLTNLDLTNPRNRLRLDVLPSLELHFNPSVRRALARLADHARIDEAMLSREASAAAVSTVRLERDGTVHLDASLRDLPGAIVRRVVQHALAVASGTNADSDDVAAVLAVVAQEVPAAEILGMRAEHSGDSVVLVRTGSFQPPRPFRFNLPVPGSVQAPDLSWVLEAEGPRARLVGSLADNPAITGLVTSVEIEAEGLRSGLVVRSREPGDRIRPLGLGGQKKLQDVFVDRKVDRDERDRVPIVTDDRGKIVWVAGHVLSEEFRVTDETKAVIILKLRRIQRPGH
jgi:tRNA(Ile)-lysidine synthase